MQEEKEVPLQDNLEVLNVCLPIPDPSQRKIPGGDFINGAYLYVVETFNFICPTEFTEQ